MSSTSNWKNHERRCAKFFGTKRILRGDDFGVSRPDIATEVSSFMDASQTKYKKIIVECKYSQDQSWKRHIDDLTKKLKKKPTILITDDLMFWKLQNTVQIIKDLSFGSEGKPWSAVITDYNVVHSTRSVPKYLRKYILQAEDYISEKDLHTLPLVCLGHKGSSNVITYTHKDYLT